MAGRLRSLATAVVLAAGALAGCGGGGSAGNGLAAETPAQIVAAARKAAASSATVTVAGSILVGRKPISIHMELVAGKGGQGRIALEGVDVALMDVDDFVYLNSDAAFYRRFAGASAARRLSGKWLKGSARGGALRAFASLTTLGGLLGTLLDARGSLSRAPSANVLGQAAIGVTDSAEGGTLYVANHGVPYPLAIVQRGIRRGKLTFYKWNQPVTLEPPAGAINIKQLKRR